MKEIDRIFKGFPDLIYPTWDLVYCLKNCYYKHTSRHPGIRVIVDTPNKLNQVKSNKMKKTEIPWKINLSN